MLDKGISFMSAGEYINQLLYRTYCVTDTRVSGSRFCGANKLFNSTGTCLSLYTSADM